MLNRNLVIGLGGSAEKLVRYLNRDVERRLKQAGWRQGSLDAWRWLCFDVAMEPDPVSDTTPRSLGETGERVALVTDASLEYRTYFHELTDRPEALPALLGSLPHPDTPLPQPGKGAGQRPQVGNAVAAGELRRLSEAIKRHVEKLKTNAAKEELKEAAHLLGAREISEPGINLFVVSSLCGGSGAGLLQIVIELLLGTATIGEEWRRTELTTVLFIPDVFDSLPPRQRDGINANALHTVAALLNGYEASGDAPAELMQLLRPGGVTRLVDRRAAVTNFFVGRSNGPIGHDHQDKVLEATAKALARIMTHEGVSGHFGQHLRTNSDGTPVKSGFRIVDANATGRPASSLGYASVSVDRGLLAEYAKERIAREQLELLLNGHRPRAAEGEPEQQTIARLANEGSEAFLEDARVTKATALAAIFGDDAVSTQVARLVSALQQEVVASDPRSAEEWERLLALRFAQIEAQLAGDEQRAGDARAAAWSVRANETVLEAVAGSVGRIGLPVTLRLLEAARDHVRELADELDREAEERLLPIAEEQTKRARRRLKGRRGQLPQDDEGVRGSTSTRRAALEQRAQAIRGRAAARLLRQLRSGLLNPLQAALERAQEELRHSSERYDREQTQAWALQTVPVRMRPADNELLLVDVDALPDELDELVMRTVAVAAKQNALRTAAGEAITGVWPEGADDRVPPQALIATNRRWELGAAAAGNAVLALDVRAADLERRAQAWVERRHGPLRDRVAISIADWVRQGEPGRDQLLANRIVSAAGSAAPLVNVNTDVYAKVHGKGPAPAALHVSTLPLARSGPAGERVHRVLRDAEMSEGDIESLFDPTSSVRIVEISGFLAQPVHPVVLDGLFVPIHRDWLARGEEEERVQFSSFRRTRPLSLFVPLSRERQRRFVVGWHVAELLGQLDELTASWDAQPLTVWTPKGRRGFPPHLLGGDVTDPDQVLARVLLSLPLAIASFAAQRYEELEAYMRILDLGAPSLPQLCGWIKGEPAEAPAPGIEPAPVRQVPLDGNGTSPEEARRAWAQRCVETVGVQWQALRDRRALTPDDTWATTPWRELAPLMLEAVDELHVALRVCGGAAASVPAETA